MQNSKIINKLYGDMWFTHKIHEKECEMMSLMSIIMRLISMVVIVIVLLLQFIQLIKPELIWLMYWSIGLTVLEVGLVVFQLNFNFDKLLDQHRVSAKNALAMRNELLALKARKVSDAKIDEIIDRSNKIYAAAPQTGWIAKKLADKCWDKEYK